MKPNEMHKLAHNGCHDGCSPKPWHDTPNLTGDYDLDETIVHRTNKDLPQRLKLYVKTKGKGYGYRTNYNGYHNYGGDD